jgi:hypothetical protein
LVAVEETLELLGAAVALYAVANYLELYHHAPLGKAAKVLRSADQKFHSKNT